MVSTGYNTKMSFGIKLIRFVYFLTIKYCFCISLLYYPFYCATVTLNRTRWIIVLGLILGKKFLLMGPRKNFTFLDFTQCNSTQRFWFVTAVGGDDFRL